MPETNQTDSSPASTAEPEGATSRGYASYATAVLVVVYIFNFIDRQIVTILAEEIKADLGMISDGLRARTANARVLVGLAAIVLATPTAAALLLVDNLLAAYVLNFILSIFASCWIGGAASTVNDLVMPRMRAVASAFYVLMATVGLALGPYAVGEVSDVLAAGGMASGESLRAGLLLSLATLAVPAIFLVLLLKELGPAEASRLERARMAGEPV